MCNRYKYTPDIVRFLNERGIMVVVDEEFPPVEIFPKRKGPVFTRLDASTLKLEAMTWGVPFAQAGKADKPVTNVRNLKSPFWASMLKKPANRCLVPFAQFCEPDWRSGVHVPARFSMGNEPGGCFAGVWRELPDGRRVYAFLTCEPNDVVGPIHEKAMPVVLRIEDYEEWLTGEPPNVCRLAVPYPSPLMGLAKSGPRRHSNKTDFNMVLERNSRHDVARFYND